MGSHAHTWTKVQPPADGRRRTRLARARVQPASRPSKPPTIDAVITQASSVPNSFTGKGTPTWSSSPASTWHRGHSPGSSAESKAKWHELQW